MRKNSITILTIIILALTVIVFIRTSTSRSETLIEQAEYELIETLRILDNVKWTADSASIESIKAQLNEALRLLEEAKQYVSEGKITDADTSAGKALSFIKKSKSEAESTLEASTRRVLQIRIFSWALVPIASFLTALTLTKGYEWYVKRESRKLLDMTITRKREKEKK